jgi:hypothetical protein
MSRRWRALYHCRRPAHACADGGAYVCVKEPNATSVFETNLLSSIFRSFLVECGAVCLQGHPSDVRGATRSKLTANRRVRRAGRLGQWRCGRRVWRLHIRASAGDAWRDAVRVRGPVRQERQLQRRRRGLPSVLRIRWRQHRHPQRHGRTTGVTEALGPPSGGRRRRSGRGLEPVGRRWGRARRSDGLRERRR